MGKLPSDIVKKNGAVIGSDVLIVERKYVGLQNNSDGDQMDGGIRQEAANVCWMVKQNAILCVTIALIQGVPALCGFWDLEKKTALREFTRNLRILKRLQCTQLTQIISLACPKNV